MVLALHGSHRRIGGKEMSVTLEVQTITQDSKGRPVATDGYPVSGLATAKEVATVTGLSLSSIYGMITSGKLPSRPFGRSRRVEWIVVRRMFLSPQVSML